MSRLRGLLPLFLCAAVLAAGAALPQLLLRHTPDYKNAPETIAIAGKESPLYLEDDTDIALPPWDVIAAGGSVPLTDYLGAAQIDGDFVNDYIRSLVGLFAAVPAEDENFLSALRVLDGTLLYLRGYTYTATDGEQYTLDLALDNSAALPLSVHVRPLSDKTHPAASPDLLLSAFQEAFQFWKTQLSERPEIYTADKDARMLWFQDSLDLAYGACSGSAAQLVSQFCTFLMACETIQLDGSAWTEAIFAPGYLEVGYAISYEDETVIVLTDYSNTPYTLYYDGAAQKITGFGLDARLAGYTG